MKSDLQNPTLIKERKNSLQNLSVEKSFTQTINANYEKRRTPFFENSLWDIKQTSQKLNVSEKTIRDWVYKRQIPFKKVGSLVRFDPSEIHHWIEERNKHGY